MKLTAKIALIAGLTTLIVAAIPQKSLAEGGVRLSLGGIGGLTGARGDTNTPQASGISTDRKFSLGAGALIEVPFVENFGIETGALYVARKFEVGNSTLKLTRTVPTLFVPLEGRFWLGDIFSVAAGAFAAFNVADETNEVTSGSTSLGSFSSGSRENPEYGMTLAAALNVAMTEKTGIFVEARYNRGFTNSARDGVFEERIDDFLLFAGARFDLWQ